MVSNYICKRYIVLPDLSSVVVLSIINSGLISRNFLSLIKGVLPKLLWKVASIAMSHCSTPYRTQLAQPRMFPNQENLWKLEREVSGKIIQTSMHFAFNWESTKMMSSLPLPILHFIPLTVWRQPHQSFPRRHLI